MPRKPNKNAKNNANRRTRQVRLSFNFMATGINVIFSITDLASSTLANVRSQMNSVASGITEASTALFFWSEAFGQVKAAAGQFYDLFIGQNERMRQQLLATQASLAAVQDVYMNGVKLTDPTAAIQAFEAPIRKSLNQIAVDSLQLVGVTSGQLTDLFQIALTNATKITAQSKEFADPIKAAERLTISFAGAFGALGIPLHQASQEMGSILTGQIDSNSVLAKGLGITNEQVAAWSAQGKLVDQLVGRLAPFVAGNALAAKSIGSIMGNLQEIVEITTRLSGEQLTDLFVAGLDTIYQYLTSIQPQIQQTLDSVTGFIVSSIDTITKILLPFLPTFESIRDSVLSIGGSFGEIAGGSFQLFLVAVAGVIPVLMPVFDLLGGILQVVAALLADPVIQQIVQLAIVVAAIAGPLATVATLMTTIFGLFAAGGSIGLFVTTLTIVAPQLAATVFTLVSALASIAGFAGSAGAVIASGSAMSVLGAAITSVAVTLGPLALAIAAVAAAAYAFQNARVGDATEAIDTIGVRSDQSTTEANNTTLRLRQLRDAEIIQGELTDQQKADQKTLKAQAANYAAQIEADIAAAKAVDTVGNESLENAKQALIAGNQKSLDSLGKYVSGLSTSAKALTELGGVFTQTGNQVAGFEKQIKEATSDTEFQAANKGLAGLISSQVEFGQISTEQGTKRLQQILSDTRVEIGGKEAAQKALAAIQKLQLENELNANEVSQNETNKMREEGRIGEAKAEQELTSLKLQEIAARSDSQKASHKERMRQIQEEMNAALGVLDKEIASKQATLDKLKATNAPQVQIVQAERDLERSKNTRKARQSEFVNIQSEENDDNILKQSKLATESAKLEKQQRDIKKREALKDFDERQKINDSARDQGLKDNQQAAADSLAIAEDRAKTELSQIENKTAKLEAEAKKQGKTIQEYDKEAWEALQVQQAEALQKLAGARKDGFEKRLSDLKQDAQEATVIIEAAQAKNDIDNQEAAGKTAAITTKSINSQIALIDKEIALSNGNVERLEELNAKKAGLEKDLTEVQKKALQQRLSDLQQDADERVAVVKSANATGVIDNQQAAKETATIEMTGSNTQLKLIQNRIAEVVAADKKRGKVSVELLEDLRKQEADTQVKITEIAKKEMDARLADLKEDAQERTAVVKAAQATGITDNQAAAIQTANIERTGANQRLEIVRKRIEQVADEAKKSGKLNVELMENLKKQEADIQVEMTETDKKEMESRLADLQQDAEERVAVVAAANALGEKDNQEAAIATSQIQQKSSNDQLKIVQDRIKAVLTEGEKTGKVNVELLEELRRKEADIQVKITEIQKQELQKRLADLREDADERTAVVVAASTTGIIDNQQSAVKIGQIQRSSLNAQLALIKERISTVNPKNKELLEDLRKQEAEVQTKITESQKQELDKRIKDLEEDINERTALVESANSRGLLDNQQAANATERIQEDGTNKQIALIQERINEVKAEGAKTKNLNIELLEELQAQEANAQKKLIEIREQGFQKQLSDLQQDGEERLALITSRNARGLADNQETATESVAIQEESAQQQLALIRQRLGQVGGASIELREKLLKLEADTQAKIAEIRKQAFDKRLADVDQDGQEQQTILEGQLAQGLTTESEYAQSRYNLSLQSLDAQLALIRERRSQISKSDIEGQEALAAQEASLKKRRQDALSQFLESQLALLDRENKKATDLLEQSELDRKLISKEAAIAGVADKDAVATAEIAATQRRIQQEIALEEQKNATLRSLPAFSDPAKEEERQSRIRASTKKTTELRLQLLDEENKAFNLLIDRQIKGIQNQSRAQELASDVQVRAIEQQGKQYDLLSRSLENQNKLLQSRASLSNALASYIQGEYKILQDTAGSEGEKNRLMKEAADAQLVAMQQQQVIAQKNLDIEIKQAEIAQKRAEFEAEIAEMKARAGSAKADAEVLKAEATLQKVQRDPNASNADVEAAKLDIVAARAAAEAAVADIAAAIANKELTKQNGEVVKTQNDLKRETQSIEQATQGRAARAQAIEAIIDPREKELSKRELAGRLTPEEAATLARTRQENRMREEAQRRDQVERDALAGKVPASTTKRYIRGAETRSASLLEDIKQTTVTPPKVPNLKDLIPQINAQRQQISAPKTGVNPLIKLQEESTGYQKEMLGVLKQINGRPVSAPATSVANNFNIKAESGISEAQVLGVFGQVSQQVTQMLRR